MLLTSDFETKIMALSTGSEIEAGRAKLVIVRQKIHDMIGIYLNVLFPAPDIISVEVDMDE